jgi:hypothetical protein
MVWRGRHETQFDGFRDASMRKQVTSVLASHMSFSDAKVILSLENAYELISLSITEKCMRIQHENQQN